MSHDSILLDRVYKSLHLEPAPRPGPCWCNGPWKREKDHHTWCREKRTRWRMALAAMNKKGDSSTRLGVRLAKAVLDMRWVVPQDSEKPWRKRAAYVTPKIVKLAKQIVGWI